MATACVQAIWIASAPSISAPTSRFDKSFNDLLANASFPVSGVCGFAER
jgi:hypothetical protein